MYFFFNASATTQIYTLSLHDALPISIINKEKPTPFDEAVSLSWFLENVFYPVIPEIISKLMTGLDMKLEEWVNYDRSEEHTSELQSQSNLVCRLLLEKKKEQEQSS